MAGPLTHFDRDGARRVVETVRRSEAAGHVGLRGRTRKAPPPVLRITLGERHESKPHVFGWSSTDLPNVGGDLDDLPAVEVAGRNAPKGVYLAHRGYVALDDYQGPCLYFECPDIIPVRVVANGGENGDATSASTRTYNVSHWSTDEAIAENVNVTMQRPVGLTLPALRGRFCFSDPYQTDATPGVVGTLIWVDEVPDTTTCEDAQAGSSEGEGGSSGGGGGGSSEGEGSSEGDGSSDGGGGGSDSSEGDGSSEEEGSSEGSSEGDGSSEPPAQTYCCYHTETDELIGCVTEADCIAAGGAIADECGEGVICSSGSGGGGV